ncbi:MAG: hypothetical protein HFI98_11990 [Lachnospiraceae bacterium]|nr:hypothetical protein [Lachnospiraceae bacterium]MCI9335439.1 hypothetical protein [Lachnospiraceae bacterium]
MNWTIIGEVSNLITAALAAFSIFITINEQKQARTNQKKQTLTEQNLNWYNEVVLNDIVKNLTLFINEAENAIDKCKNVSSSGLFVQELENAYNNIKEHYRSLSSKICLLSIFDKSLYQSCDDSLQEIFELYSETINEAASKKFLFYKKGRNIQEEYINIIEKLYSYKSNFVTESPSN